MKEEGQVSQDPSSAESESRRRARAALSPPKTVATNAFSGDPGSAELRSQNRARPAQPPGIRARRSGQARWL